MTRRFRFLAPAAVVASLAGPALAACAAKVDFDFGSARLTPATRATLDRIAAHAPGASLTITAHADAPGTEFENLVISRRRAEAIQGYLAARGMAGVPTISARGQAELLVVDHGPNRANRRTVISVSPCVTGLFP